MKTNTVISGLAFSHCTNKTSTGKQGRKKLHTYHNFYHFPLDVSKSLKMWNSEISNILQIHNKKSKRKQSHNEFVIILFIFSVESLKNVHMDQFTKNCELARMKSLNRIVFPFSSKADKNIVLKTGFLNMSMF